MTETIQTQKESVHVGGRRHVQPEQVMMPVADINYTTIHLNDGEQFMIASTIGKVQKALDIHGNFVRPNKTQVVNWAYVTQRTEDGLLLQNNEMIIFSRRKRKEITAVVDL